MSAVRSWVALVVLTVATSVHGAEPAAPPVDDPDTVAARRHFDAGLELYGLERYADAMREFERARALRAIPAFDYNIGKCQERLERWAEAIAAYERFLAHAPPFSDESSAVRARIGVLRQRVAGRGPPAPPPRRVMRALGIATLTVGAAALVAGTAAYLAVYPDYAELRTKCGPSCNPGTVVPVWNRVQRAEGAAIGLWSVAGIATAIGVPLMVLSRQRTERLVVRLEPAGVTLAGRF